MDAMVVTELVSQLLRGWLKAAAKVPSNQPNLASDARSERGRVGAGGRTVGGVSTHMPDMSVTELVSQLSRAWLKASAVQNLASERVTRGASVSASGRAGARRARSVPTSMPCSSPNSYPSY